MVTTIVRSSWTGTRGVAESGLPDDWDEAFNVLERRCASFVPTEYTPIVAERARNWVLREFRGNLPHNNLSVDEIVELYLAN